MSGSPLCFFLSYARLDGQDDNYLHRFVEDLRREVRTRCGHPSVQGVGFLDTTNIAPGEAWSTELSEALHRCHTFVAICSPTFFASEYCGKEWQAFSDRCQRGRLPGTGQSPSLLPVIWTPLPDLPSALARLQYDHVSFGKLYAQRGLRYLLQLKRNQDEYQEFLVALAERIVHLVRMSPLPQQPDPPAFHEIRSAFEPDDLKRGQVTPDHAEQQPGSLPPDSEDGNPLGASAGPDSRNMFQPHPGSPQGSAVDAAGLPARRPGNDDLASREPDANAGRPPGEVPREGGARRRGEGPLRVTFVMAVASATELSRLRNHLVYYGGQFDEWTPYHPRSHQRVCIAAQAVAARQNMSSSIVPLQQDMITSLLEASRSRNEMVVFIVDAWTTQLEQFRTALREYDNRNEPTTGILVPWNQDDAETAENAELLQESLRHALRNNLVRQDNLRMEIHTHEEFDESLLHMLVATQARIFRSSSATRQPGSRHRSAPIFNGL